MGGTAVQSSLFYKRRLDFLDVYNQNMTIENIEFSEL